MSFTSIIKAKALKYKIEEILGDSANVKLTKDAEGKDTLRVEIKDDEFTTEKYGIKIHFVYIGNLKKK